MMNGWWVRPSLSFLLGALLYPGSPLVRGGVTCVLLAAGMGKNRVLKHHAWSWLAAWGAIWSVSVAASGPVCPEGSSAESLTCGVCKPPFISEWGWGVRLDGGRGFRASAVVGVTRPGGR